MGQQHKHPGTILKEEFLIPKKVNANQLSKETGIPQTRLSDLTHGKRRITADNALRLAQFFNNSPRYWLKIQNEYELQEVGKAIAKDLKKIERWKAGRKRK